MVLILINEFYSKLRYTALELIVKSHNLIYIYIYIRVGWKVHWLTKILSWNVTKWGLFFNIVFLVFHTLFTSVLQCLDPISQKSQQQYIWCQPINFSAYPRIYIYIYTCICIYTHTCTHTHTHTQRKINVKNTSFLLPYTH